MVDKNDQLLKKIEKRLADHDKKSGTTEEWLVGFKKRVAKMKADLSENDEHFERNSRNMFELERRIGKLSDYLGKPFEDRIKMILANPGNPANYMPILKTK